jgi:hypothetical protein
MWVSRAVDILDRPGFPEKGVIARKPRSAYEAVEETIVSNSKTQVRDENQ